MNCIICNEKKRLVTCKIRGDYALEDSMQLIYRISALDQKYEVSPNHFLDFSDVGEIKLTDEEVIQGASARKLSMQRNSIKTVFYVKDPAARRMANLYKLIISRPHVSILVTGDIDEAAAFLGTDPCELHTGAGRPDYRLA